MQTILLYRHQGIYDHCRAARMLKKQAFQLLNSGSPKLCEEADNNFFLHVVSLNFCPELTATIF